MVRCELEDDVRQLQEIWEAQAASDPLWAILSEPVKRGRKWDLQEFFATGEELVSEWLGRAIAAGADVEYGTAVDFGCGIGRLSQALADRYAAVVGVDISRTMIEIAKRINRYGERVTYLHNPRCDLSVIRNEFADLVFTVIVLQHIRPTLAESYIHEFFRITKPGGLLIFHVPSHLAQDFVPSDAQDTPLPPHACTAEVALAAEAPLTMKTGERVDVPVLVRNTSPVAWTQSRTYPLNLGNRWMDERSSRILVDDDGRARLPTRLGANAQTSLTIAVTAPTVPGRYRLQLDVVQEGIRWFQDLGRATTSVAVTVCSDSPLPERDAPPSRSRTYHFPGLIEKEYAPAKDFEMHGIPKARVLEIIEQHRGRVIAVDEYPSAYVSYAYYVQKPRGVRS